MVTLIKTLVFKYTDFWRVEINLLCEGGKFPLELTSLSECLSKWHFLLFADLSMPSCFLLFDVLWMPIGPPNGNLGISNDHEKIPYKIQTSKSFPSYALIAPSVNSFIETAKLEEFGL